MNDRAHKQRATVLRKFASQKKAHVLVGLEVGGYVSVDF